MFWEKVSAKRYVLGKVSAKRYVLEKKFKNIF